MEGRVFICAWKKTGDRYRVWVKNRPKLSAEAATFEAADERLWKAILRATDDGENTREYVPPPPSEGAEVAPVRAVVVSGNTVSRATNDVSGALYSGQRCARCGNPTGGRTDVPLRLGDVESGYEGGIAFIREGPFAKGTRPFFSAKFLALLTPEERARFTWRKVERSGRAKEQFYELAGSGVDVRLVGVRGLERDGGARCEVCGWFALPIYNPSGQPRWFVCSADVPDPIPSCFMASHGRTCHLCFTVVRWQELVGKPGARGLVSSDVGVVEPDRCEREPELPMLSEVERQLAKLTGG